MNPQSSPVDQFRHQAGCPLHLRQCGLDLSLGQNHRHPNSTLHALEVSHFAEWLAKHFAIEKDHCVQRLGLGRGGDATGSGQMVQEGFDLCRPHFPGVTLAMEQNELAGPVEIGALCAGAEMATPANDGNLLKKAGAASGVATP